MIDLLKKYRTPLIFVAVVGLCFVVYAIFFQPSGQSQGSGLVQNSGMAAGGLNAGAESSFIAQLFSIQNINFDIRILNDPAFTSLKDFSKPLVPQPIGRANPFAPLAGVATLPGTSGSSGSSQINGSFAPSSGTSSTPAKSSSKTASPTVSQ